MSAPIFLIGLSGSGKSTVGRLVAEQLGWSFVDTDRRIEETTGRTVPEIFRADGEGAFRDLERVAVAEACAAGAVVVATGGGAPVSPENRDVLARGFSVWLSVSPEAAAARLDESAMSEARPLLEGDTLSRLRSLLAARHRYYEQADAAVHVDGMPAEEVAEEVVRLWHERRASSPDELVPPASSDRVAATVHTAHGRYDVLVYDGALADLGAVAVDLRMGGRAFVLTDQTVGPLFASAVEGSLAQVGISATTFAVPPGEEHKTFATLIRIYDWLLEQRVERGDFVVCLGGGVITDLGGFAAATILRGIDFIQVPTTLLGMVDAAIGGKTGVDHPLGKNMIGAFSQPRAVVIDPRVLETLPLRHRRNGWAEVVKHGLILDAGLLHELEAAAGDPQAMLSSHLIGRSVAIKAAVVSDDERERGRRMLLNYGHTLGHAIEAVTGYTEFLHGEAIAIGMHAAGLIAVDLGLLDADALARQQRLLTACGLPDRAPGLDVDAVMAAAHSDKKVRDGELQWVLLEEIGRAAVRTDVPDEIVQRAARAVFA